MPRHWSTRHENIFALCIFPVDAWRMYVMVISQTKETQKMRNTHPVDALARVRAAIKELQDNEKALKDEIQTAMGGDDALAGDEYIASQAISTRKGGIDEKAMVKAGINVESYRKPETTVITLRIEKRAN
jgi:cell division protein FtsB